MLEGVMVAERDAVDDMLAQWSRERPDLDTSGMAVVLRVLLLAGLFGERLKETLAPHDMAPWEFDVLSALRRSSDRGGVTPSELCESAQLTSGAMTHRIDRLEERGLVRREASPEDRRSWLICLTPKGLELVDRAVGARMEDAAASVASLGRADQRRLARLLRSVASDLSTPTGG
jgi:DNA-binding MarR family transcriptional regulator